MFKLIIADDEVRIREGFTRIVNWEKLGFRVVGCYADGDQVLEHLAREHVDVVFTDIKMRKVSGLEIAQHIREHYPNTVCVLISAYQEFDFAHSAIAYGVKDYLFKPTRLADVRRVFSSIAQELERESELLERQRLENRKYEEMNQLWRSQFLYDLYMGTLRQRNLILQQMEHYYPQLKEGAVILCQIAIDGVDVQNTPAFEEMQDMARRLFQGDVDGLAYDPVAIEAGGVWVMAIAEAGQLDLSAQNLVARLEELIGQARAMSSLNLELVETQKYETVISFSNRPRPRLQSSAAAGQIQLDEASAQLFLQQQRLLLSYLSVGNSEQAHVLIQEMVEQLKELPRELIYSLLVDTIARIHTRLQEMKLLQQSVPRYDLLLNAHDQSDMIGWMTGQLDQWVKEMPAVHTPRQVVRQIQQYIEEHIAGPLSLDAVADHVFLSPVYVSRLFKQETGENFTDYITHVRIEKAKYLLEHMDIRVSDVGERTGYSNPRYFYRVFKNTTGLTPSEYRRSVVKEESL